MSSTPQKVCPACNEHRNDVEFKTDLGEGDVFVCEDCYNKIEAWQEEEETEEEETEEEEDEEEDESS